MPDILGHFDVFLAGAVFGIGFLLSLAPFIRAGQISQCEREQGKDA